MRLVSLALAKLLQALHWLCQKSTLVLLYMLENRLITKSFDIPPSVCARAMEGLPWFSTLLDQTWNIDSKRETTMTRGGVGALPKKSQLQHSGHQ